MVSLSSFFLFTSAATDKEAKSLLTELGLPFKKN